MHKCFDANTHENIESKVLMYLIRNDEKTIIGFRTSMLEWWLFNFHCFSTKMIEKSNRKSNFIKWHLKYFRNSITFLINLHPCLHLSFCSSNASLGGHMLVPLREITATL